VLVFEHFQFGWLPFYAQNVAKLFAGDTKLYATVNNTNDERNYREI
jgi:hypothetical protein